MAIGILDNNEYTSVQAFILLPSENLIEWFFNPTDLITARRLVGYTLQGTWENTPGGGANIRNLVDYCSCQLTVAQPLNQSVAPEFTSSSPLGGVVTQITNEIHLLGNVSGVSIVPTDVTIFRIVLTISDTNLVGFPADLAGCNLTLFWDQPRQK